MEEGLDRRPTRPHALLLPYPALGHIRPMMQLAHCLARRNFIVTFVNTEHNHALIHEADGKKNSGVGSGSLAEEHKGLDITLMAVPDGLAAEERRSALDIPKLTSAIDSMLPSIERLILKLGDEGRPVTCIIVDATCVDVTSIAEKLNIARACFWCPSVALARMFYEYKLYESNADVTPEGLATDRFKIVTTSVAGVPQLRGFELPWLLGSDTDMTFLYQTRVKALANLVSSSWFLCNSCMELEEEAITSFSADVRIASIGPLLGYESQDYKDDFSHGNKKRDNKTSVGLWMEDNEGLKWLDNMPKGSVVYLAFGSLALFDQVQVEELAMGIEASDQAFLWVLRVDLMASLPEGFLERTKERGRVITWAPQQRVLSHPGVGFFVTHCGWNSCLEAVYNGVPTIAWPYFADQFTNRGLLVDTWKVGIPVLLQDGSQLGPHMDVGPDVVRRERVTEMLMWAMTSEQGKELRARAAKLKLRVRTSVQPGGPSYSKLDLFIDEMQHHASKM